MILHITCGFIILGMTSEQQQQAVMTELEEKIKTLNLNQVRPSLLCLIGAGNS